MDRKGRRWRGAVWYFCNRNRMRKGKILVDVTMVTKPDGKDFTDMEGVTKMRMGRVW